MIMDYRFLTLLLLATATQSQAENFEAEMTTNFELSQRQCSDYFSTSLKKGLLLLFGQIGNDVETMSTKCWINCVLQKSGFMTQNPKVPYDPSNPMLDKMIAGNQQMEENSNECKDRSSAITDPCERGYIYVQCMFKKWRQSVRNSDAEAALP